MHAHTYMFMDRSTHKMRMYTYMQIYMYTQLNMDTQSYVSHVYVNKAKTYTPINSLMEVLIHKSTHTHINIYRHTYE